VIGRRTAGLVVGLLTLALGVLAAAGGPIRAPLGGPIRPAVGGLLALAGLYGVFRNWEAPAGTDPPAVERATAVTRPGADIDGELARSAGGSRTARRHRRRIHDRLRAVAEWTLARERGWSRDRAAAAIDAAEWPDDTVVARFLAHGARPRSTSSIADRVRSALTGDEASPFRRAVHRTVAALDVGDRRQETGTVGDGTDKEGGAPVDRREVGDGTRPTTTPSVTAGPVDDGVRRDRIAERDTDRWAGAGHLVLVLVGVGLALRSPVLAAGSVVVIAVVAHARAGEPAEPVLSVDRSIAPERPAPGDSVTVSTSVTNAGTGLLPDLRLVDGVPADLAVDTGSPRHGTALRPGETTTIEYTVSARRGTHAFGSCLAITRDLGGTVERVTAVDPGDELTCEPRFEPLDATVPLAPEPAPPLGRLPTATGDGVAFESTREYRAGDPIARVDWKRVARYGEFTTVTYTEERAARVAIVVDARGVAAVSPDGGPPTAVDRCVDAAGRVAATLLDAGDRVGLATMGADPFWLRPGTGAAHRSRIRTALATHPAFTSSPSGDRPPDWPVRFHRRFPRAQLLFVSPLVDWAPLFVLRQLAAYGHPATVLTPDPTRGATLGERIAGLDRDTLVGRFRDEGIGLIEWPWDEELDVALARGQQRSAAASAAVWERSGRVDGGSASAGGGAR
jgi:uncharacterized protein (DUF58 family)